MKTIIFFKIKNGDFQEYYNVCLKMSVISITFKSKVSNFFKCITVHFAKIRDTTMLIIQCKLTMGITKYSITHKSYTCLYSSL